jgi:hypothetical protein
MNRTLQVHCGSAFWAKKMVQKERIGLGNGKRGPLLIKHLQAG